MLETVKTLPEWLNEYADKNLHTLWQVVKAYRANLRQGTVGVKTRSQVKSTGKKPYKQKKTGSARRGSFVSSIHVGGGVAHGPTMRDYRESIPHKMATTALGIALARRVKSGNVLAGELEISTGKTKDAFTLLGGKEARKGSTLVCLAKADEKSIRAYKNIQGVVLVKPEQITAFDVIKTRRLVVSQNALGVLEKRVKG